MIACRPLISCIGHRSLDLAQRVPKLFTNFKSVRKLQICCFHGSVNHNLRFDAGEVLRRDMYRKKQSEVSCVWRRVSTQSSASQEFEVGDIKSDSEKKNEVESHAKEVQGCISPQLSTSQCENQVKVGDDQQTSLWSMKTSKEIEVLQGEPTTSTEGHAASVKPIPLNAKHSVSLEVGSSLIRFIKGKGGATQRKVEEEMGVQIIFPSSKKDESIIVEGDCADSVNRASKRIQDIVNEAVKSSSLDYSHFVSLPLAVHPQLVDKLVRFQNSILGISEKGQSKILSMDSDANSSNEEHDVQNVDKATEDVELKGKDSNEHVRADVTSIPLVSYAPKRPKDSASEMTSKASELGIERSIFIKPKTFHLTVLMLKLWKEDLVKAAAEVLQNVSSKVIQALESRPVYIQLKGLECMRGSFAKARVLYAPVEEIGGEERLLRACQVIIDAFVDAGLVLEKDAKQKLKLHATVMNARHRKRKTRTKKVDFFDARSIVDQYGSEDWGVYLIREAHLSQRFLFDEHGYYHCCTSIPFPEDKQQD